jgi:diguanylate cyclase (GGDEF)-like protein
MITNEAKQIDQSQGIHDIIVDLLNSLSALRGLSELDSQAANEKDLVANALSVLMQNQDMERCSFFILEDNEYLVNVTGLSLEENVNAQKLTYQPIKFKVGEGVIGLAAKTGELQHCRDCKNDARFQSHQQLPNLLPGCIISAPVTDGDELVGVLNISHPEAGYFSDWHIRLLHIYRNMLGQLISNSRLFQRMEDKIVSRTAKLQQALTDVEFLKKRFESMSMIDELTGLYNRRYFYAQAAVALSSIERYGQALCLLVLDLDYFKKINDCYGHLVGDQVLINVASALKNQMRESDIAVRFGGEEFVVVFTNTDCENGMLFAERIREGIAALSWNIEDKEINVTVSIGITCLEADKARKKEFNIDSLIHNADVALYEAKERGRNQSVVFSPTMLEKKS